MNRYHSHRIRGGWNRKSKSQNILGLVKLFQFYIGMYWNRLEWILIYYGFKPAQYYSIRLTVKWTNPYMDFILFQSVPEIHFSRVDRPQVSRPIQIQWCRLLYLGQGALLVPIKMSCVPIQRWEIWLNFVAIISLLHNQISFARQTDWCLAILVQRWSTWPLMLLETPCPVGYKHL